MYKDTTTKPTYRYKLIPINNNSAKYGNCEVCGRSMSAVFHQIEERQYHIDGRVRWTHYKCHNYFGHKKCMESKQR